MSDETCPSVLSNTYPEFFKFYRPHQPREHRRRKNFHRSRHLGTVRLHDVTIEENHLFRFLPCTSISLCSIIYGTTLLWESTSWLMFLSDFVVLLISRIRRISLRIHKFAGKGWSIWPISNIVEQASNVEVQSTPHNSNSYNSNYRITRTAFPDFPV